MEKIKFITLIISAVYPPEPVVSAKLSENLFEALNKSNDSIVLCPKPTRPYGFKFSEDVNVTGKVIRLNSFTYPQTGFFGRFYESFDFGKKCAKYINENHKFISCIYLNSWPLFSQYFIIKTAKKYGIPCITHIQDIYPETLLNKLPIGKKLFGAVLRPMDKYILENSANVICISENMRNILQKSRKIQSDKFSIIPNWQDEAEFLEYRNLNGNKTVNVDELIFMYLGNNGPVAGVDFLITCFHKAKIPNSKLIIAGSGSRTEMCKKLARELNVENIEFVSVPNQRVPHIQDMADIMLLPVKRNGAMSSIPSKLPAYMFSSKPIIGSLDLESDTARAIIEADCGLVVEPENTDSMVEAMQKMSNWGSEKLSDTGTNGFNYAMKHFSKKVNLNKLVEVIQRIN